MVECGLLSGALGCVLCMRVARPEGAATGCLALEWQGVELWLRRADTLFFWQPHGGAGRTDVDRGVLYREQPRKAAPSIAKGMGAGSMARSASCVIFTSSSNRCGRRSIDGV